MTRAPITSDEMRRLESRTVLSVREAARLLNVSVASGYKGVHDGTIPAIVLGGRIVVPRAKLFVPEESGEVKTNTYYAGG